MSYPPVVPVPFARPDITEAERKAVDLVLRSGNLSTGYECAEFETAAGRYLSRGVGDPPACIAVNSATSGFEVLFRTIGLGPGDEVIFPVTTYVSPANEARKLGATVRFVDIDPRTMNMSLEYTLAAINERTKVVVPTHFAGYPLDIPEWRRALPGHVMLIDDTAHAWSSGLNGQMVGDQGADASVFSFYATKPITTGEGGMIVTRTFREKSLKCRRLDGVEREFPDDPAMHWSYDVALPGLKANMPDTAAAIGLAQLRRSDEMRHKRAAIADFYDFELANLPITLPPRPQVEGRHSWHLYVIRLGLGAKAPRDDVIRRMYAKGVQCSAHFRPITHFSTWRVGKHAPLEAEAVYENCISLPIYSTMTGYQAQLVVDALREAVT